MKLKKLAYSFKFAFAGIWYCVKTQRNFKIHLCAAVIVGMLVWWQRVSYEKIAMLVFAAALVLLAEMFNTAIETVVDMISTDYSFLAKIAKDIAAGAVLLAAVVSLVIGYLVFFC